MFDKLKGKLTATQRTILGLTAIFVVTILIGFCFHQFLYKPQVEKLEVLKQDLQTKKKQLEEMQFLATKLAAKQRIKAQKEAKLRTLEKGLPQEEYIPTLLTQIESLANELRVEITSFSPGEIRAPQVSQPSATTGESTPPPPTPVPEIEYKEMSLPIPFQGTYTSLKTFLNKLAEFPMVIVVESLQITKSGALDKYDNTPLLGVTLPTTVYILPPGEGGENVQEEERK